MAVGNWFGDAEDKGSGQGVIRITMNHLVYSFASFSVSCSVLTASGVALTMNTSSAFSKARISPSIGAFRCFQVSTRRMIPGIHSARAYPRRWLER